MSFATAIHFNQFNRSIPALIYRFVLIALGLFLGLVQVKAQSGNQELGQTFKITPDASKYDLFELIDTIEVIRLETTIESRLKEVNYYTHTQNGFIIPDQGTKEIYFFTKDGTYQHKISRLGQGAEEYGGFSNVWVKDEFIEFYDSQNQKLHRYTREGILVEVVEPDIDRGWRTGSMHPTSNGYIINMLDPSLNDRTDMLAIFLDAQLKLNQIVARQSPPNPFPVNLGQRFSKTDTALFYRPVMSDIIYQVDNNQAKPFAKMELGEHWLWSDPLIASDLSLASTLIIKDDTHVFEILPKIGNKYIALTYYYTLKKTGHGLIERTSGRFWPLKLQKKDKSNFSLKFLDWEGERLVTTLPSYELEEFLVRFDKGQWSIRGGHSLESLLNSENPVIIKVKFKAEPGVK